VKRLALHALLAVSISGAVLVASVAPVLGGTVSAETAPPCEEQGDGTVAQVVCQLADLHSAVDELIPQQGIAHSLDAKVDATTQSVLALNITAALNQIDAFQNEVDGLTNGGVIPVAVSNIIKTKHDTVKNTISNLR
jgi:hypothetical protein